MTRSLSDADTDLAIRQGLCPDAKSVLIMPSHGYASFTDDQVASIIAYLRFLSPQGAASPDPRLGLGMRVAIVAGIIRPEAAESAGTPPPLDLGVRHEKGRHLAQGICRQCHGTDLSGEPKRPVRPSSDLLVVASYDRNQFRTLMRKGRAPGGRHAASMLTMADGNLSNLTDDEINLIYDYLIARAKAFASK
jgi:mono/diheme cytochrome c family protein